jgi:hypothetical protein
MILRTYVKLVVKKFAAGRHLCHVRNDDLVSPTHYSKVRKLVYTTIGTREREVGRGGGGGGGE